jgi:hypothetical protein
MSLENMKSIQGQIQKNISKIKVEKNIPAIQPTGIAPANVNLGSGINVGQHTVIGTASSFTGVGGGVAGGAGSVGGGSRSGGGVSGAGGDSPGGGKQAGHSGA